MVAAAAAAAGGACGGGSCMATWNPMRVGKWVAHHLRTWKSDLPLKSTSSTLRERPVPGHRVLSSVNQPSLATSIPCAMLPGMASAIVRAVRNWAAAGEQRRARPLGTAVQRLFSCSDARCNIKVGRAGQHRR
jgi:hypothetical protein